MHNTPTVDRAEVAAFAALSLIDGVGVQTLLEVRTSGVTYQEKLSTRRDRRSARDAQLRLAEIQERTDEMGARMVSLIEPEYPAALLDLESPPALIFCKGNLAVLHGNASAVVGTRISSKYGDRIATALGAALAGAGVCVVSGLARGIDSAAHRGALKAEGYTCAVLGTGLDITYPAGHATLQRTIAEKGLIMTECLPGETATRWTFPKRNRIIAALSRVTFVVEAGRTSGAIRTTEFADMMNRIVAAIPGPIDSQQSEGTNQLLRDGAHVIASIDDALTLAGANKRSRGPARHVNVAERAVLDSLGERTLTTEQLVDACGLPVSDCMAAISSLELDGLVEAVITGEIRRTISGSHVPAEVLLQ